MLYFKALPVSERFRKFIFHSTAFQKGAAMLRELRNGSVDGRVQTYLCDTLRELRGLRGTEHL